MTTSSAPEISPTASSTSTLTTTPLIQPPLDPEDEPVIHPNLQLYITHLTDTTRNYTRFFSALLIPTSSHDQFFQDLRSFRQQPSIIYLFSTGTSPTEISANYRLVTQSFVESRFAHPWCRVSLEGGQGWRKASWIGGSDGKAREKESERVRKEEERLHRLLVPIWIAFRRRICVEEGVVHAWFVEWEERPREEKEQVGAGRPKEATTDPSRSSGSWANARDDDDDEYEEKTHDQGSAEAAAKMFVGAAITSFVMSDKRITRYVKKKLLKGK